MKLANDGLDENGLQDGFWKTLQDELFFFKYSSLASKSLIEIQCAKMLQYEIPSGNCLHLGNICSIYKSSEPINHDTVPLIHNF